MSGEQTCGIMSAQTVYQPAEDRILTEAVGANKGSGHNFAGMTRKQQLYLPRKQTPVPVALTDLSRGVEDKRLPSKQQSFYWDSHVVRI